MSVKQNIEYIHLTANCDCSFPNGPYLHYLQSLAVTADYFSTRPITVSLVLLYTCES